MMDLDLLTPEFITAGFGFWFGDVGLQAGVRNNNGDAVFFQSPNRVTILGNAFPSAWVDETIELVRDGKTFAGPSLVNDQLMLSQMTTTIGRISVTDDYSGAVGFGEFVGHGPRPDGIIKTIAAKLPTVRLQQTDKVIFDYMDFEDQTFVFTQPPLPGDLAAFLGESSRGGVQFHGQFVPVPREPRIDFSAPNATYPVQAGVKSTNVAFSIIVTDLIDPTVDWTFSTGVSIQWSGSPEPLNDEQVVQAVIVSVAIPENMKAGDVLTITAQVVAREPILLPGRPARLHPIFFEALGQTTARIQIVASIPESAGPSGAPGRPHLKPTLST
jgi:hypothetical protein